MELIIYDFGEKRIWPKPELSDPYSVLDWYERMMSGLKTLPQHPHISSGRSDHLVKSLDTLVFALRESLFQAMVLREALTGFQTRELADAARAE